METGTLMKVTLKGINKVTKRLAKGHQATYWYHRATGRRLPGAPGSASNFSARIRTLNALRRVIPARLAA